MRSVAKYVAWRLVDANDRIEYIDAFACVYLHVAGAHQWPWKHTHVSTGCVICLSLVRSARYYIEFHPLSWHRELINYSYTLCFPNRYVSVDSFVCECSPRV